MKLDLSILCLLCITQNTYDTDSTSSWQSHTTVNTAMDCHLMHFVTPIPWNRALFPSRVRYSQNKDDLQ